MDYASTLLISRAGDRGFEPLTYGLRARRST